ASMSAMGSVVIVPHQLAFVTPGSSPLRARFRRHNRQRLKSRYTARGRPHAWQRFLNRVENLGGRASFAHWDARAIFLAPEGHSELREELLGFLVAPGRRHERDVHAFDAVDTVEIDLREHDLFLEAERVVARAVEGLRARAAKVANAR